MAAEFHISRPTVTTLMTRYFKHGEAGPIVHSCLPWADGRPTRTFLDCTTSPRMTT